MTLVTFAVPFESAAFRRRAIAREVRVVHTGVGAAAARAVLERAVCDELPERVISSGFAGALVPGFQIADVVSETENRVARRARFATSPAVLATAAQKREFQSRTGAEVVDMETDAIREVCRVAMVPLMLLRAISDGAEDDLALPPELLDALAASPVRAFPRLAWTLAFDGRRRRDFVRLVGDCRKAQQALADALECELSGRRR